MGRLYGPWAANLLVSGGLSEAVWGSRGCWGWIGEGFVG
jgi:hypothetical protein